jgi:hypothetical protein
MLNDPQPINRATPPRAQVRHCTISLCDTNGITGTSTGAAPNYFAGIMGVDAIRLSGACATWAGRLEPCTPILAFPLKGGRYISWSSWG